METKYWVVTEEGIPRGIFKDYHDAERFRDRHGSPYWRLVHTPYYG